MEEESVAVWEELPPNGSDLEQRADWEGLEESREGLIRKGVLLNPRFGSEEDSYSSSSVSMPLVRAIPKLGHVSSQLQLGARTSLSYLFPVFCYRKASIKGMEKLSFQRKWEGLGLLGVSSSLRAGVLFLLSRFLFLIKVRPISKQMVVLGTGVEKLSIEFSFLV
ncbi:unnamed protein product [Cochlearia groenlandica]